MSVQRRAALVAAAPLVLVAFFAVAWWLLPPVHPCRSSLFFCGRNIDPGGANVFGLELFTPGQSIVMAIGIWAAAAVLGRGVLPARSRWVPIGFGALVLAVVVTLTMSSPTTGPAPSVPCSTPGPSGRTAGRCAIGSPPVDERVRDRTVAAAVGVLAFGATTLIESELRVICPASEEVRNRR